jgi:hypothetical protein
MSKSNYNTKMSSRDIFIKEPLVEKHSGEDIHAVINSVHLDYESARKSRYNIEGAIYYRDLLSFLIKTYGH